MANWPSVRVRIRCSNSPSFAVYKDVWIDGLGMEPWWIPEDDEIIPDLDGYTPERIRARRHYFLTVRPATSSQSDFDTSDYDEAARHMHAKYKRIVEVIDRRTQKTDGERHLYWTTAEGQSILPVDVRAVYEAPDSGVGSGLFRWTIEFIDVRPTVGVVIS